MFDDFERRWLPNFDELQREMDRYLQHVTHKKPHVAVFSQRTWQPTLDIYETDSSVVVTVDLEARVISVFRNGYEIGASAVLLGTEEKPTPTGVFPITQKKRHHVSNIYDSEMPYMQRLTDDGITLHATDVAWGYASHGCIGMPEAFARKVFETTSIGDKVYITRGKMIGVGDALTS